jgi:hypothetical protein
MRKISNKLYEVSWGFSIIWLGISIIVNYYYGVDLLGLFLVGVGTYGIVMTSFLLINTRVKMHIILFSLSLVSIILGSVLILNLFSEWIMVLGILLIIFGVTVMIYNVLE